MAVLSELTMILGVEARERATAVLEKVTGAIQNVGDAADITTGEVGKMGTSVESSFLSASSAADRLETSQLLLTDTTNKLADAQTRLDIALAAAKNDASAANIDALRNANNDLTTTMQSVTQAQSDVGTATSVATSKVEKHTTALGTMGTAIDAVGPYALGAVAGVVALGAATAKSAEDYQTSTVKIANSAGISTASAKKISDAFLATAGTTTFSAQEMADSYAGVAGQLRTMEGHALTASQSVSFMTTATTLSEASGESLGSVTTNLAKIMQAYSVPLNQASSATSSLFQASSATGVGFGQVATQLQRMKTQLGDTAPNIQDASTLLIDMAAHGQSGRYAMQAMSTGLNTLLKTTNKVTPTQEEVNKAYKALPSTLKSVAESYSNGSISATQFSKETAGLSVANKKYITTFKDLVDQSTENSSTLNALSFTPAQQELSHLGISATDAGGKFIGMGPLITQLHDKFQTMTPEAQKSAMSLLFGASAAKKLFDVVKAGGEAWKKYSKQVADKKAVEEAAQRASNSYEGSMHKLRSTIDDVKIEIGNALLPTMTQLINHVVKVTGEVLKFINHNKELFKIIGIVVGVLTTFVGGMYAVDKISNTVGDTFGKVSGDIKKLLIKMGIMQAETDATTASVEAQTIAQEELNFVIGETAVETTAANVAMEANPIGLLVMLIAGLVIGLYELIKHSKLVRDIFKEMGRIIVMVAKDIFKFMQPVFKFIVEGAKEIWAGLKVAFSYIVQGAKDVWGAMNTVAQGFMDAWHFIDSNFIHPLMSAVNAVINFFKKEWILISAIILLPLLLPIALAVGAWMLFGPVLVAIVKTMVSAVVSAFHALIDVVKWIYNNIIQPIIDAFTWLWTNGIEPVIGYIIDFIMTEWEGLQIIADWIMKNIIQPISSAFTWLWKNGIEPIMQAIGSGISWYWKNVISPIVGWVGNNIINPIINLFSSLPGAISSALSTLGSVLMDIFHAAFDVVAAVWNNSVGLIPGVPTLSWNAPPKPNGTSSAQTTNGSQMSWQRAPGRASGGSVYGGSAYMVGENGPELMIPNASGTIIPNHALGGGGSSPVIVNVTISGQVYGSLSEFAQKLGNQLATQTLPSGGVVLTH